MKVVDLLLDDQSQALDVLFRQFVLPLLATHLQDRHGVEQAHRLVQLRQLVAHLLDLAVDGVELRLHDIVIEAAQITDRLLETADGSLDAADVAGQPGRLGADLATLA